MRLPGRLTRFAPLVLIALLSGCGANRNTGPEPGEGLIELRTDSLKLVSVQLSLETVIGREDQGVDSEELLGRPNGVVTDKDGLVYVSDQQTMTVKVFDRRLGYLKSIGGRGDAPGEFKAMTSLGFDGANLLIEDERQGRFTVLATNGEILRTSKTDDNQILWPRKMRALSSGQVVYLYKMPNSRPGGIRVEASDYLLHVFDRQLQFVRRFGDKALFGPLEVPYVDLVAQRNPGSLAVTRSTDIWYVPYLYAGSIHRFSEAGVLQSTLKNTGVEDQTFAVFPPDISEEQRPERLQQIRSSGGEYNGIVLQESLGLIQLSGGQMVHFSLRRGAYTQEATVPNLFTELFQEDGSTFVEAELSLEGFDPSADWLRLAPIPPLEFAWGDAEDRVYVLDKYRGLVWVYRIELISDGA